MTTIRQSVRLGVLALEDRALPSGVLPVPDHVVVVVLENHGFPQIRGNPDAAYLNALADGPDAALLTSSFALTHPSQPNYLHLFSGSNQGILGSTPPGAPFATPNLGAALRAAGRTFIGYSEGLPEAGSLVASSGDYVRRHNPWSDWQGAPTNGLPPETNLPFRAFPSDFTRLPTVAFVVPDQQHNMHDGTIAQADAWLQDQLGAYELWTRTHNGLLIVTFDEDDGTTGNQVFTLFVGQPVRTGSSAERTDHFGLLRTIVDFYGLPPPGASAAATPLLTIWDASPVVAVGADAAPGAKLLDALGTVQATIDVFGPDGVGARVALGDVNRDGVGDLVAGTSPGRPTRVRVIDGRTQAVLFDIAPFEPSFTGGVFVAAGDVTGDGFADFAITPDEGGGPRVRVFNGSGFGQLVDFFGIDDPAFRGGARPAIGDLDGDGHADLVVGAGFGGGPRVAAFNGQSLGRSPVKLFADFLAFEPELRNGAYMAVGDVTGDGLAELVAGGGPGGGPRVSVFEGAALLGNVRTRVADFFAGDPTSRDGVRVAVKDLSGHAAVIAAVGSRVRAFPTATLSAASPPTAFDVDLFPGVFVG